MLKLKLENINKTFDGKNFVVKNFNLEVNNEYRKNKRRFSPSPATVDRE